MNIGANPRIKRVRCMTGQLQPTNVEHELSGYICFPKEPTIKVATEILKIIEHGLKGDAIAVRAYAGILARKCNPRDKQRIEDLLNNNQQDTPITID